MQTTAAVSLEYQNDYFSIALRETGNRPGDYFFTSGLSLPRFDPLCWGKTGICSNAAFKGLQQLRADVSLFALQRGIVTKNAVVPTDAACEHGDGWYQVDALLIEGASPELAREILDFSARNLVQTIMTACHSGVTVPAGLDPAGMQQLLESLRVPNYREAAPHPISKPNGETFDGRR